MAAPASITLKNLNGDFVMNKKLSDDPESILLLVSSLALLLPLCPAPRSPY